MFTRQELFQLFRLEGYTEEQVESALKLMAEYGEIEDAEALEFPTSITVRMEQLFKSTQDAVNEQKSLPGNQSSAEEITTSAIALAQSKLARTNTKPELISALIRSLFQKDIETVATIIEMRRQAINVSLQQGESSLLQDIFASSQESAQLFAKMAANPEAIKKMLAGYGITDGATERSAFIQQSRDNAVVVRTKVQQFLQEAKQREQQSAKFSDDVWDILLAEDM